MAPAGAAAAAPVGTPTGGREAPVTDEHPAPQHVPVLLARVAAVLAPALAPALEPDGAERVLVDATVGLGGHTAALLTSHPGLTVIGLDRDRDALRLAAQRLAEFGVRVVLRHVAFDRVPEVLDELDIRQVDGVLFDLGVSSMQLDTDDRGFSYARDTELDMRMDRSHGPTAADVLNTYPADRLARLLREYGEERFAARIAAAVVRRRQRAPLRHSAELVEVLDEAIPAAGRRSGGNPAKRTFQALRIEVNGELDQLRTALPAALDALRVGGRIVVLSYHSLEDRIVKRTLADAAADRTPIDLPVPLPDRGPRFRLLGRAAGTADADEIAENPRAASVRMRAAERVRWDGAGR